MSISAAPCPTCVFGATSTSILSFSYHAVETITVSVIPHITVYTNGTEKTSYQSITETDTLIVGSGTNTSTPKTFTNQDDITWTVGDATLTYPTTYVHYLGFDGALATSDDTENCVDVTDASSVELPSSTNYASFIYPLAANATEANSLPTPLLEYLGELSEVSSQFHGAPLTGCAPITWRGPVYATASTTASSFANESSSTTLPQISSATTIPLGTNPAPVPQTTLPTASAAPYPSVVDSSSSRPGNYTFITTKIRPSHSLSHKGPNPQNPETSSSVPGSSSAVPSITPGSSPTTLISSLTTAQSTQTHEPVNPHNPLPAPDTQTSEVASYSASAPVEYTSVGTPAAPSTRTTAAASITHTTAFVIEPITGKPIYTTVTAPGADHTKPHEDGPDGYSSTKDGSEPHTTPDHNSDQPDNSPHHTGGNNGATQQHNPDGPQNTGGSGPESPGHTGDGPHHTKGPGGVSPADNGDGPTHAPQVYTHGHTSVTAGPGGAIVIGSKTVKPGHEVTIGSGPSKTVVALHTEGKHTKLVIGGSTYGAVPHSTGVTPAAGSPQKPHLSAGVITTDGHTITAIRSGKSIIFAEGSSTTTIRGGGKATFGGQTISAPQRGGSINVNGEGAQLTAGGGSQAVVTAGGHKFTAIDVGKSIVLKDGSSTVMVKDGSQTVFHGQTVSIAPSGTAIVVNGKTTTLSEVDAATASASAIVTAGGHTITALDKSGSVVLKEAASTATIEDGSVVTFAGQTISVKPNGSAVVVNGATTSFSASATTTGVGSYITGGLSGGAGSSPSPSVTPAATNAAVSVRSSNVLGAMSAIILGFVGVLAIL